MAAHWLPCPQCQNRLRVEASQAGQSLRCSCGADVEAPTLRGLAELEPIVEAEHRRSGWGAKQGLALVAAVAAVFALAGAGYIEWSVFGKVVQPEPDVKRAAVQQIESMSPGEAWYFWQTLKAGLHDPKMPEILAQEKRARFWQRTLLVVAAAAAVAAVAMALLRRRPGPPPSTA